MSSSAIFLLVLGLGAIAWFTARGRAAAFAAPGSGPRPHSRPNYHGWYVALWVLVPACLFLAIWSFASPGLVMQDVLGAPAASSLPTEPMERAAVLAEVRGLADGSVAAGFNPASEALAPVYRSASERYSWIGVGLAVLLAVGGGAFAFFRLKPDFRARTRVERVVMICLLGASLIAILTTIGIVASLLFESIRFFAKVSPLEFLFGLVWSPQTAIRADQVGSSGAFGAVPLFWGTVFIGAIIAMVVAIP
ncbi:MAG: Phosphate transport system permease protein, partial [Rhizorhabdus sp.]|nr:Phosphate transport system permease protein [Rhizorhabdus sp.]